MIAPATLRNVLGCAGSFGVLLLGAWVWTQLTDVTFDRGLLLVITATLATLTWYQPR